MTDDQPGPGREGHPDGAPDDQTVPLPAEDRTEPLPPGDETMPVPGDDRTMPAPGDDRTVPVPDEPTAPVRAEGWYARASVPQPSAPATPVMTQWGQPEEGGRDRWWLPIVFGIVALVLLGVLVYGLWLIDSAEDDDPGPVTPTASAIAPTRAPSPTAAAPTTAAEPSPSPELVSVPFLVGVPLAEARKSLNELGLTYRVRYEESSAEEGIVLATDPDGGTPVEPGSRVELVVAEPPTEPPPTEPSTVEPTGAG